MVFRRESSEPVGLVLPNSGFELACDSHIQDTELAGQDVDVIELFCFTHALILGGARKVDWLLSEITLRNSRNDL